MATKIISCNCKNEFQDTRYGQGRRVHNQMKDQGAQKQWRCAVCQKETSGAQPVVKVAVATQKK
jgi:hypothetical protein